MTGTLVAQLVHASPWRLAGLALALVLGVGVLVVLAAVFGVDVVIGPGEITITGR